MASLRAATSLSPGRGLPLAVLGGPWRFRACKLHPDGTALSPSPGQFAAEKPEWPLGGPLSKVSCLRRIVRVQVQGVTQLRPSASFKSLKIDQWPALLLEWHLEYSNVATFKYNDVLEVQ